MFITLNMSNVVVALLRFYIKFMPHQASDLGKWLSFVAAYEDDALKARLCERILAVYPQHVDALQMLAEIRLSNGEAYLAAELLRRRHEAISDQPMVIQAYRMGYFDHQRYNSGFGYVVAVRDVLLDTGYWAVLKDGVVNYIETQQRSFWLSPIVQERVTPDKEFYIVSHPPVADTIDTHCILLGGDDNYAHWVTRNLIKLYLLESKRGEALPYLVNADLQPHQLEYLDLLGIGEHQLVKVSRNKVVACRKLTVPTGICNRLDMGNGIAWLRGKLAGLIEAAGEPRDLIYVSRRGAQRRELLNEAELESALLRLGFITIEPGQMTVREQITAFARARAIVAPHGAALANLVYAPRGAFVIEITSVDISHMADFRSIARSMGQHIVTITSDDYETVPARETPEMHRNYRVNVADVLTTLRREGPRLGDVG
jgi:hypothetical protein